MAINSANLKWYLSGGASNSDHMLSLGGARSTTTTVSAASAWDAVTGDEASAGDIEYRCHYFRNEDATSGGLQNPVIWISVASTRGTIAIALSGAGKNGTASGPVANENTAPSTAPDNALSFTSPANKAAGLALGTLVQNDFYPVWTRRTIPASTAALASDTFTLTVEGDSAA